MKKSLIAGLSAIALVASAASVVLVGNSTAHAAGQPSSAFGIEATGLIPIEATPFVESTDGSNVSDTLVEIPGDPLLGAGVVEVEAENGYARATVADLAVGDGLLAQLPAEVTGPLSENCATLTTELQALQNALTDATTQVEDGLGGVLAELNGGTEGTPIDTSFLDSINDDLTAIELAAVCDMLAGDVPLATATKVEAECTGDTGNTTVADLQLLGGVGATVDTTTIASALGLEDVVKVTENRQTANPDGTFTVDALVVQLLPGTPAATEIVVASATCGEVTADAPPPANPPAPEPEPVPGNLPVTG